MLRRALDHAITKRPTGSGSLASHQKDRNGISLPAWKRGMFSVLFAGINGVNETTSEVERVQLDLLDDDMGTKIFTHLANTGPSYRTLVYVEGSAEMNQYTDSEGKPRTALSIVQRTCSSTLSSPSVTKARKVNTLILLIERLDVLSRKPKE